MAHNTPFSFHCMICFEEFHQEDRYPVVLPCGHTYVCITCANRLDKCMECRTPLYTIVPIKDGPNNHGQVHHGTNTVGFNRSAATSSGSWSSSQQPGRYRNDNTPPPPSIKKRLALPKNVVLLSLIEATELASEDARKKFAESPLRTRNSLDLDGVASIPLLHSIESMMVEDDEEEERIKMSTSLAVGVAGTYAVAVKDGLEILSSRPRSSETTAIDARDEDIDNLVKFYNCDNNDECEGTPNSRKSRDHLRLCFGDRVQIVSFCGGWAKLARGYGYVKADKNALVKVGGSVDRACKLEAMLCTLSNRRKELRIEQNKVDNQFIRFMNDLQHSLQNDEDLTVILADTFSLKPDFCGFPQDEKEEKTVALGEAEWDTQSVVLKPERPSTPPLQSYNVSRFACFSGSVFDQGGNGQNTTTSASSAADNDERMRSRATTTTLFPASSHPSPSAMRAGAQAWRERNGRPRQTGGGINFRTGMSGHMALLSSHANSHKYLDGSQKPMRMSSHSGLGVLPSLNGILNSLTLPVIGNTPPRRSQHQDLRHNGSM